MFTAVITQLYVNGQDCIRQVRTKYDSAQNLELSAFFPTKNNNYLNSFDFAKIVNGITFSPIQLNPGAGWQIPGLSGNSYLMHSPYSSLMGSKYAYLRQGASADEYDIYWEDGWELMWLNTGYFPDNSRINILDTNRIVPQAPLSNPKTPYIILYNRYTGKLRAFANLFADLGAYDTVRMWLQHPPNQNSSGIFRHLSNYDQTLDEPAQITEVSSYNENNNNNNLWWSSDYQLGYDPCVCHHLSEIEFRFTAINHMNVNLFGRFVQSQVDLSALGNADYANFLTNESVVNGLNSGKGGSLLFKRFDSLLVKYDHELELYNTQANSYNSPFNSVMRDVLKAAKDGASTAGANFLVKPMGDFFLRQLVKIGDATKGDTTQAKAWAEEVNKSAKGQLGKAFDFIAIAGLGDDFFQAPQRPSMPTATFGEMRIAGTISEVSPVLVSNFFNPGSWKYPHPINGFDYPAYNNAVGLYALLRKPVVNGFQQRSTTTTLQILDTVSVDTFVSGGNTTITTTIWETENWDQHNLLSLRVDEPLKYKLNRALDFDDDKTRLYVSFVVELENDLPNSDNCFTLHLTQKDNENFYLRDIFPVSGTNSYQLIYETLWKDMEDIGVNLFKMDFKNSLQPVSQRINQIIMTSSDTVISIGELVPCVDPVQADFKIKKIKMKVAADMYFHQRGKNGLQNNTFQTFTYLLYDPEQEIYNVNFQSDSTELLRYKQANLVL
ncbi:MAG TPA: hypothetical protein VEC12_03940, partial [Bacteroidia bacterium]|nr:hypothetical protein [Bacteroidia bacterium]